MHGRKMQTNRMFSNVQGIERLNLRSRNELLRSSQWEVLAENLCKLNGGDAAGFLRLFSVAGFCGRALTEVASWKCRNLQELPRSNSVSILVSISWLTPTSFLYEAVHGTPSNSHFRHQSYSESVSPRRLMIGERRWFRKFSVNFWWGVGFTFIEMFLNFFD